ncbi:PhzF family phenazine biosynthesis protein [Streptomyces sporangiiformans]|uniref:PhzF family phenazine biosynthesis protein n=1 Tax=Streptomyces sporangiiformans TaxID=2315329 RepID=UPI0023E1E173|nr:PhzF family phenazine biosynthesis isomerase [Streptomyces sporangiiformans]
MGTYEYVVADVFTDVPLEGNPVAVFVDSAAISPERMQQIAQEMHLSETVFVLPAEDDGDVRVRIFTPVNELPFAGHRTRLHHSRHRPARRPSARAGRDRVGDGRADQVYPAATLVASLG